MKAYETAATIEREGELRIAGIPFAAGTEVEVTVMPRRKSAEEFSTAWHEVCEVLRSATDEANPTDDEIQREIDDYRAGR